MTSQSPACLCTIYIGVEAGAQEVPDAIWPIEITFVSLEPTRILMFWPDITSSGPISIEPVPGMPATPFTFSDAPGFISPGLSPELAAGMGMSIFSGEATGDAAGIGIFISFFCCEEVCGIGEVAGICIPGIFISIALGDADGEGLAEGIAISGMFMGICPSEACGVEVCD
jgi:hypothetical protein